MIDEDNKGAWMKNKRAMIAVLLGALLVGTSTAATAGTVSTPKPTKAGNQKLAATEAASLQALAPASLPPGAVQLTSAAKSLFSHGFINGKGSVESKTSTTYWSATTTPSATLAWVKSHPPAGLRQFGTSTLGSGLSAVSGFAWAAELSAAWDSAELNIGVTSDGSGSAIRAEAIVVWLDPTPFRDSMRGPRVHLTVAGDCPATIKAIGVHNAGNDLRSSLVPKTTPTAGLTCSYAFDGKLVGVHALNGAASRRLATAARALPLAHSEGGSLACPIDIGAFAVVALSFPHRPDVDLWLETSGCGGVANGLISSWPAWLNSEADISWPPTP